MGFFALLTAAHLLSRHRNEAQVPHLHPSEMDWIGFGVHIPGWFSPMATFLVVRSALFVSWKRGKRYAKVKNPVREHGASSMEKAIYTWG